VVHGVLELRVAQLVHERVACVERDMKKKKKKM
jgi:hypothetical protein